jgi:hypothetical protein
MDHETHSYNFNNPLQEKEASKDIANDIESLIVTCCRLPIIVVIDRQAPCIHGDQQKDELIEPANNG